MYGHHSLSWGQEWPAQDDVMGTQMIHNKKINHIDVPMEYFAYSHRQCDDPQGMTISLAKPMSDVSHRVIIGDSINSYSKTLLKIMSTELPLSTSILTTLPVATFSVMAKVSSWG